MIITEIDSSRSLSTISGAWLRLIISGTTHSSDNSCPWHQPVSWRKCTHDVLQQPQVRPRDSPPLWGRARATDSLFSIAIGLIHCMGSWRIYCDVSSKNSFIAIWPTDGTLANGQLSVIPLSG